MVHNPHYLPRRHLQHTLLAHPVLLGGRCDLLRVEYELGPQSEHCNVEINTVHLVAVSSPLSFLAGRAELSKDEEEALRFSRS